MLIPQVNPTDWLTEVGEAIRRSLVLITGEAGSGVTFLARAAEKHYSTGMIDLDLYCRREMKSGYARWICDIDKLRGYLENTTEIFIVAGRCDNFNEVVELLAPEYCLSVYLVSADPETYRQIHTMRALEGRRNRVPETVTSVWISRAKQSPSKIREASAESLATLVCCIAYGVQSSGDLEFSAPFPPVNSDRPRWRKYTAENAWIVYSAISELQAKFFAFKVINNVVDPSVSHSNSRAL